MSSQTPLIYKYSEIGARADEIKREGQKAIAGEMPKVWPSMAHSDSQADDNSAWGYMYRAPDDDCA